MTLPGCMSAYVLKKMLINDLMLVFLRCVNLVVLLKRVNKILLFSHVSHDVEQLGVCITFTQPS